MVAKRRVSSTHCFAQSCTKGYVSVWDRMSTGASGVMRSAVITGCNRGLGLGLVKIMTQKRPQDLVLATCRNPEQAHELQELSKKHENLHVVKLDLLDFDSYETAINEISNYTKECGVNLLINNAGVTSKFTTLNYVKPNQLTENFTVNTVAPILLTKQLLPLLKLASQNNSSSPMGINRAAIVNMSSILGSIGLNNDGGFYPYRCSKTALNAATRSMSVDLKKDNIIAISMHPGWVRTDMGGPKAPLDVETSVREVLETLETLDENSTGRFYQHDGTELQW